MATTAASPPLSSPLPDRWADRTHPAPPHRAAAVSWAEELENVREISRRQLSAAAALPHLMLPAVFVMVAALLLRLLVLLSP